MFCETARKSHDLRAVLPFGSLAQGRGVAGRLSVAPLLVDFVERAPIDGPFLGNPVQSFLHVQFY
jgi:hypothetical protein